MTLRIISAFACSLSILVSCSTEPEQNPIVPTPKATIKGVVLDIDSNEPIYYAMITTIPPTREIHTDLDGNFLLEDLPPKEYMVYGYTAGFDDDSVLVSIADGDTAVVNLYLNNFGEYLDYYPLEVGNYWEYWTPEVPRYSLEVISDTTINSNYYFVIPFKSLWSGDILEVRYERVDTINALVYRFFPHYNKEMIIDSLPAKANQRFSSSMWIEPYANCFSRCSKIEEKEIFGETRNIRNLYQACGQDMPSYSIVKGLGLYNFNFFRVGGFILKYAIIKGVEYGEKP